MKMRKVVVLFLSAVLVFVGCGNENKIEANDEMVVQSGNEDLLFAEYRDADGNFDFKGETITMMWQLFDHEFVKHEKIRRFEEECNAKVEFIQSGWGSHDTKLVTAVASGQGIDLAYIYGTSYQDYIVADLFDPIDAYMPLAKSLAKEDDQYYFHDGEMDFFTLNGKHYAFSNDFSPNYIGFFYNTTMMDEAGLEYPYELEKRGEWTHEKFMEYARILTVDKDGDGVTDQFGIEDRSVAQLMMLSNDTDIVYLRKGDSIEPSRVTLDSPETLRSLTAYETMLMKDKSIGGEMVDATAAMAFRTWGIRNDLTENFGLDGWGFCKTPVGPDNTTGKSAGLYTEGWGMPKGAKNPVAATVLAHYYLNITVELSAEEQAQVDPFRGFKSKEDSDRFGVYMSNLKKEDGYVLNGSFIGDIGTKPLGTVIEENMPVLEASLEELMKVTGYVMAGEGKDFESVTYEFESDISPLMSNSATTTNALVEYSPDNGGAMSIKTDLVEVWDLYATTDAEKLVFEPGHSYKVSFDYTLNEELGPDGRYYLVYMAGADDALSDTQFGFDAIVGEKNTYEVEFGFYHDYEGGHLRFGGFNTSDILIENLTIETVN